MSKPQLSFPSRIAQIAASVSRFKKADDTPADDPDCDDEDDEDEDDPKPKKAKPKKADDDDEDAVAAHRHVGPVAAAILRAGATRRVPLGDGDKFIVNPAPQQTKGAVRDPVALAKLIVNSAKKARGQIT